MAAQEVFGWPCRAGGLPFDAHSEGGRAPDHPAPLLVIFDGQRLLASDVTATFDNLAADGAAEPLTAVIVESIYGSAPRGLSRIASLTVATGLESFVFGELLPTVEARYPVTSDPARRVVAGHSLGAVAALHLATQRCCLFSSVVAGSPALWWPGGNGQISGADVAAAYLNMPRRGRLFLNDARAFRDSLVTAGHDLAYQEFRGGHDHACWRGSLADGIVDVLGKASRSSP